MQYKNFLVNLQVSSNNTTILDGVIKDDTANIVHVQLMDGEKPFNFSGYTDIAIVFLLPTINPATGENVRVVARVSSEEEFNTDNPYSIRAIDPKTGRIDFALQGALTQQNGQYFAQIKIFDAGEVITSAQLNYRVRRNLLDDAPAGDFLSVDQLTEIQGWIDKLSALVSSISNWSLAEDNRETEEASRRENEASRINSFQEISTQLTNMMATIQADLEKAEESANLAYEYSRLAQGPTMEALIQAIRDRDIPTRAEVAAAIDRESTSNKTLGTFNDPNAMIYRFRQGNKKDLPTLMPGEFGFCNDTHDAFIGSNQGNVQLNKVFEAGETAPEDTKLLWIDTLNNNAIKFYDEKSQSWKPTSTSVFG